MECNKIKEMLNSYLDNELPAEEVEHVKAHLETCDTCRQEFAELEEVKSMVKSLPHYSAPAELAAKLESAYKPAPQPAGLLWRLRWAIPPLATAAAVTLVVYISVVSMPRYSYYKPEAVTAITEKMNNKAADEPGLLPDELNKVELRAPTPAGPLKEGGITEKTKKVNMNAPPDASKARGRDTLQRKGTDKTGKAEDKFKEERESKESGGYIGKPDDKISEKETEELSDEKDGAFGFAVGAQKGGGSRKEMMMKSPTANEQPKAIGQKLYQVSGTEIMGSAVWYLAELEEIIRHAQSAKHLVVVYFYFSNKDYFPKNRDEALMRYSLERGLFTRVFVRTENNGKISDPALEALFNKHKLTHSAQCVVLDCYGNLVQKVPPPVATNKITAAIDAADKKVADIEALLNKDFAKAEELAQNNKIQEQIKTLKKIINTGYRGYATIEQSRNKLDELNQRALATRDDIIKNYMEVDEDDQEPDKAIKELESVIQTYKGLPAEKELKDNIKGIKESQTPSKK